jgi:hypothetical protein
MEPLASPTDSPAWRSRIVGHAAIAPDQLLANPLNWRIHPRNQQLALADTLEKVGWVRDVLVNQRTGHVLDGHLRVTLALRREEATVPVLYVDLSEEEEKLVLVTLDPLSEMAVPDGEQLAVLLGDVGSSELPGLQGLLETLSGHIRGAEVATQTDLLGAPVMPVATAYQLYAAFPDRMSLKVAVDLIAKGRDLQIPEDGQQMTVDGLELLAALQGHEAPVRLLVSPERVGAVKVDADRVREAKVGGKTRTGRSAKSRTKG